MKHTITLILVLLVGLTLGQQVLSSKNNHKNPASALTAYERVISSDTLRCGYFVETPFTFKNDTTGDMQGIAAELTQTITRDLGLNVTWGMTNFTTLTEDLHTGKFDAICASVFILPRAGRVAYSRPYVYVPIQAYATPEFVAHTKTFEAIDWSNTTVAGIDGEGATTMVQERLPQATLVTLPAMASISEMLTSVTTGKADVGLVIPTVFNDFNQTHPGALVPLASDKPLHVFPISFAVKPGEHALKHMLDAMILRVHTSGELDVLINKYDAEGVLYKPNTPYSVVNKH